MLLSLAAYGLAFPLVLVAATVVTVAGFFLRIPLRPLETAWFPFHLACNVALGWLSVRVGVWFFEWACTAMGVVPHLTMYLLPFLAFMWNDLTRLHEARSGTSRVAMAVAASGEDYHPLRFVRSQQALLVGRFLGFL